MSASRSRIALLVSAVYLAPLALDAQRVASAPTSGTVLFVCEHGTVKSVLAKFLFERYAKQVGLRMKASSRGTNLDPAVPAWMQQHLDADHISLGAWRPRALRPIDLADAKYVVSFDVPSTVTAATRAPREQWDGLPSVSKNYDAGRDAIDARVRQLVDSLKRAQTPRSSRTP